MDRVFTWHDSKSIAPHWVAVAIGQSSREQLHIGILHRRKNSAPEVLHLAWHHRLQNDSKVPHYLTVWVATSAPMPRQRSIAAFCRRVWKKNERGEIPYAFSHPDQSFDPVTGAYVLGPSRFGLTCASFVLAVFQAAGLSLADYSTWPADRPGDRRWQEDVLHLLERCADREHIQHVRQEIGAVRYRPEEVAATVALAPPPATFLRAEAIGKRILDLINT